jgi:large subunit ribosomal protein L25
MDINDTITLAELTMPAGITLLDEAETTVATLSPPRVETEEDEIEEETGLVGEAADTGDGDDAAASDE